MAEFKQTVVSWKNWDEGASVSASGIAPGFPVENLLYDQPREYCRTADSDTSVTFTIDISENRLVNQVSLLYCNITNTGTWRVRGYPAGGHGGSPTFDSGTVGFWAGNIAPYDRVHSFWHDADNFYSVDRVVIDVNDAGNPDGFLTFGTVMISAAWQPSLNISFGSAPFGFIDPGSRQTALSGVTHVTQGGLVGEVPFIIESNNRDELYLNWHRVFRDVRNSKPLLITQLPEDSLYALHSMTYGVINQAIAPVVTSYQFYRIRLSIRELN